MKLESDKRVVCDGSCSECPPCPTSTPDCHAIVIYILNSN